MTCADVKRERQLTEDGKMSQQLQRPTTSYWLSELMGESNFQLIKSITYTVVFTLISVYSKQCR